MKLSNELFVFILPFVLFTNCSNEKSSWNNACSDNTTTAYEEFLKSYPDGVFADSARMKIEGRKVLIYTVPAGLNIYFVEVDTNLTKLQELGGKWVQIYDKTNKTHYLIDKNNSKGESPIVLKDIMPGHYLFAIEPVEFYNKNMRSQNIDPFLKPVGLVSSFQMNNLETINKFKAGELKLDGAIIYSFEKEKDEKGLIIIYAKDDISLEELENSYPEELSFEYDMQKLQSELREKNFHTVFSEDETTISLDLLKRGGKVAVQKGDIKFLIQILDEKQFAIETLGRIK